MTDLSTTNNAEYETPTVEYFGTLVDLTGGGGKYNSFADFQSGQPTSEGPGS